jgi:glyoxylase-like metal-dependent hydrolase (beta-lactamase superfamily II)
VDTAAGAAINEPTSQSLERSQPVPRPLHDPRVNSHHVVQLSERLAYWTEPHPNWRPNSEWPEQVACVTYATSPALVVIDPLIRDDLSATAWDWLDRAVEEANDGVAVLLTAPWHERSTRDVIDRYDAEVWIAPVARGRIRGLPMLRTLPTGIEVFTPRGVNEGQVAFFIAHEHTLVVAEFFVGTGTGLRLCPSPATSDIDEFVESMNDLRLLPIDRVLVAHGQPVLEAGKDAIAAALDTFAGGEPA